MCLDTYYDINSVRQHNFFFITQGNYVGYMLRNQAHRDASIQVRS